MFTSTNLGAKFVIFVIISQYYPGRSTKCSTELDLQCFVLDSLSFLALPRGTRVQPYGALLNLNLVGLLLVWRTRNLILAAKQ
jgi:hypothetical protein